MTRTMKLSLTLTISLSLACGDKDPEDDTGDAVQTDLILSTGFGSAEVDGTASGGEEIDTCAGSWPDAPQHLMVLESDFFDLGLRADTTEVVVRLTMGQSEWCSDNNDGLPAIVRGTWSAGEYEIYVGVPEDGGGGGDYTLTAVESYYSQ